MIRSRLKSQPHWWMGLIILGATAGCSVPVHQPGKPPMSAKPIHPQVSRGTLGAVRQLMERHQLVPLRTSSNADYAVKLLFQPDKLSYYVVLLHDDDEWRVVQSDSESQAQSTYDAFVRQAEKLAEVDIDALRLKAGNAYAQRMVALNEQRLQNLRRDVDRQNQQAAEVATEQRQAQQQATVLSRQLQQTSTQLDALKARIRMLEAQQANPETTLPMPSAYPDAVAPSAEKPFH